LFFTGGLKVRTKITGPGAGSGSTGQRHGSAYQNKKCHGSPTLFKRKSYLFLLGHISFQLWYDCPRRGDKRRSEERSDPNRRKSLKQINIKSKIHNVNYLLRLNARNENINLDFEDFFSNCFYFLPLPTQLLGCLLFPCPVLKGIDRPFPGRVESILIRSLLVNWRLGYFLNLILKGLLHKISKKPLDAA
jgi:hypothetical protein